MNATGVKYEHNKNTGITGIVIYSKSEEGKAFVHANCVFVHEAELTIQAIQVNESGLTLECCIWFCSIPS
jgi:hypothetical protein